MVQLLSGALLWGGGVREPNAGVLSHICCPSLTQAPDLIVAHFS